MMDNAEKFNTLAMTCERKGDGHKALEYYVEALKIHHITGELDRKAAVLNNIGRLLKNHGQWSDALDCFDEVKEIMHEKGNLIGEAIALCNMGTIYMNLGNFVEMLKVEQQALKPMQFIYDPAHESACRSGIAIALYRLGTTTEAISYLEQSIELLKNNNLPCDASGATVEELQELLHSMRTNKLAPLFDMIAVSNAMLAFITAANWREALQIFEQHKTLLSHPELESTMKAQLTEMRQMGERQQASNLQAHLSRLQRAKKHRFR